MTEKDINNTQESHVIPEGAPHMAPPEFASAASVPQAPLDQPYLRTKKKTGLIIGIAAAALIVCAVAAAGIYLLSRTPAKYGEAQKLYSTGEYAQAMELFAELEDYKDSTDMVTECKYQEAILSMKAEKYQEAEDWFSELDGYKDSQKYLESIPWKKTVDMLSDVSEEWITVGDDGSYIAIDTNPDDIDSDDFGLLEYAAMEAAGGKIEEINRSLGFPSSLLQKMNKTTAMQGTQTDTVGKVTVSWSYHPDNGLEVTYEFRAE